MVTIFNTTILWPPSPQIFIEILINTGNTGLRLPLTKMPLKNCEITKPERKNWVTWRVTFWTLYNISGKLCSNSSPIFVLSLSLGYNYWVSTKQKLLGWCPPCFTISSQFIMKLQKLQNATFFGLLRHKSACALYNLGFDWLQWISIDL